MKRKTNKWILFSLIPLAGLICTLVFSSGNSLNSSADTADDLSDQSSVNATEQKPETPAAHEPLYISVFKFIVNSNPFKKQAG